MRSPVLFIFCLSVLGIVSCNDHQENASADNKRDSFLIKVNIKNIADGSATLRYRSPDYRSQELVDSVPVKDGSFTFSGKLDHPEMLSVLTEPGGWSFDVFAENADITINGDTTGSEYYDQTKYGGSKWAVLKNVTITGSQSQDEWKKFEGDPTIKGYDSVINNFYQLSTQQKDKDAEYSYRDKADSVRDLQMKEKIKWIDNFAKANPSSVAGVYMFSNLYTFFQSNISVGQTDSILHNYSGEAVSSPYYKFVADNLAKRKAVSPGQVAPDFTLLKRDSTPFTLSSLRGKYVMIDFWASWCHPCRQAIPHWKKVYAEYHPKGLEIVSVSDDARWADWKKAMDVEKMPWTQVCDEFPVKNEPARVGSLYMTTFIPFYVLLDKEGKILVYSGNEADIDAALKKNL